MVPSIDKELHAINGCWKRNNQPFLGMRPLTDFPITSSQPQTHTYEQNYILLYMFISDVDINGHNYILHICTYILYAHIYVI